MPDHVVGLRYFVHGRHHHDPAALADEFDGLFEWLAIGAGRGIPMALALKFMGAFNEAGHLTAAYYVMAGPLNVSFVTLLIMRNVPDANIEDRDHRRLRA